MVVIFSWNRNSHNKTESKQQEKCSNVVKMSSDSETIGHLQTNNSYKGFYSIQCYIEEEYQIKSLCVRVCVFVQFPFVSVE